MRYEIQVDVTRTKVAFESDDESEIEKIYQELLNRLSAKQIEGDVIRIVVNSEVTK